MAHWHSHNPWARTLTYLPDIEEVAACYAPHIHTDLTIRRWEMNGQKLDLYLIEDESGSRQHSFGIRYGGNGEDYLSPHMHPRIAELLLAKYAQKGA